jgi:hypothetical protein
LYFVRTSCQCLVRFSCAASLYVFMTGCIQPSVVDGTVFVVNGTLALKAFDMVPTAPPPHVLVTVVQLG